MIRSEPEPIVEMRPVQFAENDCGGWKGFPPRTVIGMWIRPSAIGLSVMRVIDMRPVSPKMTSTEFVPSMMAGWRRISGLKFASTAYGRAGIWARPRRSWISGVVTRQLSIGRDGAGALSLL